MTKFEDFWKTEAQYWPESYLNPEGTKNFANRMWNWFEKEQKEDESLREEEIQEFIQIGLEEATRKLKHETKSNQL